MNEHIEEEGLKHLEQIEQELGEIKERTPTPNYIQNSIDNFRR